MLQAGLATEPVEALVSAAAVALAALTPTRPLSRSCGTYPRVWRARHIEAIGLNRTPEESLCDAWKEGL
jgi:hypothetical protein